jgi:hypothetical protein
VNVITYGQSEEDTIPTVGFNMRKVTKGKKKKFILRKCHHQTLGKKKEN